MPRRLFCLLTIAPAYAQDYDAIRRAAEQGDASARVPQDDAEAVRWFRLAAEQGVASAQFNLGVAYAKGEGVPQDYVSAHMWLNLAASTGHKGARRAIPSLPFMTPRVPLIAAVMHEREPTVAISAAFSMSTGRPTQRWPYHSPAP